MRNHSYCSDEIKNDEPEEGEREFEVHGRGGAEGYNGVVRAEKGGGEEIEEGAEEFREHA